MLPKVSIVLLFIQLASASLDCDGSLINVDGFVPSPQKNKAGLGEFPWTVALFKKDAAAPHCAGAIIGESTILTTAFCVKQISNPSDLIIRAGLWDLNKTRVEGYQMQQKVASVIKSHPKYTSPEPIDNDIAIVHLSLPLKLGGHVQKVCLDDGSQKVSQKECFGTGWGAESYETQNELSQYLKKVQMDRVDSKACEKQLQITLNKESFILPENFFCAGGFENDLCIGDSGAPFVCPVAGDDKKFVLSGLSSYGVKCFTETPGVYTDVSKFFEWIREEAKEVPAEN